jgi:hypothetical protein
MGQWKRAWTLSSTQVMQFVDGHNSYCKRLVEGHPGFSIPEDLFARIGMGFLRFGHVSFRAFPDILILYTA